MFECFGDFVEKLYELRVFWGQSKPLGCIPFENVDFFVQGFSLAENPRALYAEVDNGCEYDFVVVFFLGDEFKQ